MVQGDRLGLDDDAGASPPSAHLWISFGSVFEGDLGVEVATCSRSHIAVAVPRTVEGRCCIESR